MGTKAAKNIIYTGLGQILIIILGIILPRFILLSYGSETNGLLSAVNQIFTYIALLEAGIGNAALNQLYKIDFQSDKEKIDDILSTARYTYVKFSLFYIICVVIMAIVYPFLANTTLPYSTILLVILIQGVSSVLDFLFSSTYRVLFVSFGNNYVANNINTLIRIISYIFKIFLVYFGCNIIVVQLSFLLVEIIKQILYYIYFRKCFPEVQIKCQCVNQKYMQEKNAFLIHEISSTIFSSTDVIIISIFCDMAQASVYSVYSLIYVSLNTLISTINKSTEYILGQNFKSAKHYVKIFDTYNSIYVTIVFLLFTEAYLLTIPFLCLYTKNVNDVQYIDQYLPLLFTAINIFSAGRAISARTITLGGCAKATQNRTIIEAVINIISSVILVNIIGIYGVLLGTVIALCYRVNDIIIYCNKRVLNRRPLKTYLNLVTNIGVFCVIAVVWRKINHFPINSYFTLSYVAIALFFILTIVYFLTWMLFNQQEFRFIVNKIKRNDYL